jgi:membrane protein DedA with SNARE-associated domain
MNLGLFIASNFAGTLVWCAVLAYLGFLLGVNYAVVHAYIGPVLWIALAGLIGWAIVWLARRRAHR